MLQLEELRCNHETEPFGVNNSPVFSWVLTSDKNDVYQTAYQLRICSEQEQFDTGWIESDQSVEVTVDDLVLKSCTIYQWNVTVWDSNGEQAEAASRFETGLESFKASWIEPSLQSVIDEKPVNLVMSSIFHVKQKKPVDERLAPVTLLRRNFTVKKGLSRARAYATAHGIYRLAFNGRIPDDRLFAPEYTSYDKFLLYQTYDITDLLQKGENACGALVADGWWAGRIGMGGECSQYGNSRALLLQLELIYEDETKEYVVSDENFRCSNDGIIRYSDIFIGEKQDLRKQETLAAISQPTFDDRNWSPVIHSSDRTDNILPQIGAPVRKIKELTPVIVLTTPKGEKVIDFGQVFAGFVQMKCQASAGTVIKLEHSEVLDKKGNFLSNIMGANKDQTDYCISSGKKDEVFEPVFTFHGFRYVKVSGIADVKAENFKAYALSTDMRSLMDFSCSNKDLNQLSQNVFWSQCSNMLSIPTDCPQRERAGWMADAQVFAPTACFNFDMEAFFTRWMRNVVLDQTEDGQFPIVVPFSQSYQNIANMQGQGTVTAAGWSEAGIIVPYTMYQMYGDKKILEQCYPSMQKWMRYMKKTATEKNSKAFNKKKNKTPEEIEARKYIWDTGWQYGDWMAPSISKGAMGGMSGAKITRDITASIYYAYATKIMSEIAEILHLEEDVRKYTDLYEKIRKSVAETYIDNTGKITPDLQGSYVMALWYGIVPKQLETASAKRLNELIIQNGYRLDTGFLSTPILLDTLEKYGYHDTAVRVLLQEKCPSWIYAIRKGATTIWESWDGIQENGKVGSLSYNHYAFGCVMDWIYRNIGGIHPVNPGFKEIAIHPMINAGISNAYCKYHSVYGDICCIWEAHNGDWKVEIQIPCNTRAIVTLPNGQKKKIGSGKYTFNNKKH